MAQAIDTIVEDTQQPPNCASIQERGVTEKCLGGVGSTTTNRLAKIANCRKRARGSSLGKVRMHFNLNI